MKDYSILSAPRIRADTFARILRRRGSPAAPVAHAAYQGIVRHRVDPALALAVFQHESSFGKLGAAVSRRNWGNLRRSPHFPTEKGFVRYPSWDLGAEDAARLLAVYGRNAIRPGTRTDTARLFPKVWAPSADGNRPRAYGEAIVRAIDRFVAFEQRVDAAHAGRPVIPSGHDAARWVARFDRVRIRTHPSMDAAIIRFVGSGTRATGTATVQGSRYDVNGDQSTSWIRITAIDGVPLRSPLFSAALLWRQA